MSLQLPLHTLTFIDQLKDAIGYNIRQWISTHGSSRLYEIEARIKDIDQVKHNYLLEKLQEYDKWTHYQCATIQDTIFDKSIRVST